MAEPAVTKIKKRRRRLSDFEVVTVGLVKSGANRRRFPIVKGAEEKAKTMDAGKLVQIEANLDLIDGMASNLMKSLEAPKVAPAVAPVSDPKVAELTAEVKAIAKRLEERDEEIAKLKASVVAKEAEIERIKADRERPASNAIPVEGPSHAPRRADWESFYEELNKRPAR